MAARVFVALRARQRKCGAPEFRPIDEGGRLDLVQHTIGNPNIGHFDRPTMEPARQQQVAYFFSEERHRVAGVDGNSHDRPGGAVYAARQIDRDYLTTSGVYCGNHGARQTFHIAVEAGAKQRIDDDIAFAERTRRSLLDRPAPALGRDRSIALEPLALADEADAHFITALGQMARRDKPVAA